MNLAPVSSRFPILQFAPVIKREEEVGSRLRVIQSTTEIDREMIHQVWLFPFSEWSRFRTDLSRFYVLYRYQQVHRGSPNLILNLVFVKSYQVQAQSTHQEDFNSKF